MIHGASRRILRDWVSIVSLAPASASAYEPGEGKGPEGDDDELLDELEEATSLRSWPMYCFTARPKPS